MKNVKLEKAISGKGWFLTIGDDLMENTWSVTSEELWIVHEVIEDNMDEILQEMKEL